MIPVPSGVKVWLATGHTDMRKGFPGLSLMVQETLKRDPMCGHLFVFRGRGGGLIKVIWHDGQGACPFTKKLERGRFIWPSAADGTVVITPAQLGYLLEGIDWRMQRDLFSGSHGASSSPSRPLLQLPRRVLPIFFCARQTSGRPSRQPRGVSRRVPNPRPRATRIGGLAFAAATLQHIAPERWGFLASRLRDQIRNEQDALCAEIFADRRLALDR
ncbi:IS66 family insertion sequence element accessory protein TnpB (plasmid) [Rhizobium leguminosarum bv. trifolii TA1]|nr:IS66 family insertion sequence element accessory protein TnpB [Rhizobium leguminosarum bv. trifolii TA1]